jgi:hypothetical protein
MRPARPVDPELAVRPTRASHDIGVHRARCVRFLTQLRVERARRLLQRDSRPPPWPSGSDLPTGVT